MHLCLVFNTLGTSIEDLIQARPLGAHGARKNLNFVAPEVLQKGSKKIGTKSDVWMLGCSEYLL